MFCCIKYLMFICPVKHYKTYYNIYANLDKTIQIYEKLDTN